MAMEKSPYRSTVRKISGVRRHPASINTLQTPIVLESGLATLCSQESISKIKNANQHERKEIRGLNDKLANHIEKDLRDETTQRLIEAARVKSLENELAFSTDVHALEMKEYRSMLSKMKNQPSLCDIPKADVESMVSDLSKEYESQLQQITTHLENRYSAQITNLRNQMNSLEAELEMIQEQKTKERNENEFKVNELRSEIELLLKQLKDLMDSKLTLETEISTYRKLLDGDDNSIRKSDNNATNVKDWTLTQATENGESYTHTFTDSNVFSSSKFIKIWGHKHGSVESGIVSSTVSEWSALSNPSTITLKDNNNKDSLQRENDK
ncbi:70 kDa neurofilament protein-like [Octopus vulgaris]|uniref:70 kDa neurofilament protein-like n=1 Tax=Octopus vulgaris TaxID=6645 RepID=A0AA36FIA2_OCTVU|nr:70 kDa neurofilament protein-like [Octopus vulgaris]